MGAGFALARRIFPRSTALSGLIVGGIVWGISYLGLMPALGLYPWPNDDSAARILIMIVAHGVYGTTTAQADELLSRIV